MLCGVALHDELAELQAEVGPHVFDDPVAFRAAFDDFIPEGSATTGEVSLLVGAISTGTLQRLREQLTIGADPSTSIAAQAELLARDRGTSESSGAYWALSVLAHALGAVPAEEVATRPTPPDSIATAGRPIDGPVPLAGSDVDATEMASDPPLMPRPPTAVTDETAFVSEQPRVALLSTSSEPAGAGGAGGAKRAGRAGRVMFPLLIVVVAVLTIVSATALVLLFLFLRDSDSPDDTPDDQSGATEGSTVGSVDHVLKQIELEDAGKIVRVQLVDTGRETDAELVMLVDQDGDLTEVDRQRTGCSYIDKSFKPQLQIDDLAASEISFGWRNRDGGQFFGFGQVRFEENLIIVYGSDYYCPAAPSANVGPLPPPPTPSSSAGW
jgi:hypothetical protein